MKITQLPSAGTLSGTEELPIFQTGHTKKLNLTDLPVPSQLSASSGAGIVGTTHGTLSTALDTLFTVADTGASTITFAANGSIVETRAGLVITTAFSGNTITETYSGTLSKVVTTTFNADGSISRTEA